MALLLKIIKKKSEFISILSKNKKNFLILFLSFFLIFFIYWSTENFGSRVSYVQIIYNLFVSFTGIKDSPFEYKLSFYLYVINMPIFLSVLSIIIIDKIANNKSLKKKKYFVFFKSNSFFKVFLLSYGMILTYCVGAFITFFNFDDYVFAYLRYQNNPKLYSDPKKIEFLKPDTKKNLIIFYYESLEYDVKKISNNLEENPIKEIDDLKGKNIFNFKEAPATSFSIAGVVASQCSLPFYPTISLNLKDLDKKKMLCLSDILDENDYKQFFYITVDKNFHDFGLFKETHNYVVNDKHIIKKDLNLQEPEGWGGGVSDHTLLKHAKNEIIQNYKMGEKFNVTIINTDTHTPYQVSPECKIPKNEENNSDGYKVYKCASILIKQFFDELEKEGVLKDTVVVIMGDHLTHDDNLIKNKKIEERNVYFKMNTDKHFTRNKMNHYDVAPTILDELGFLPKNVNKFGFGVSLFNKNFDYDDHYKTVMNENILSDYYLKRLLNYE